MSLSADDIAALSRLLDIGQALPASELEAWLNSLPAEQQALVPHLRRMLAPDAAHDSQLISTLPPLGDTALPEPAEAAAGALIGPYRLLAEIGRGGMGSVWRAARVDGIFEREVAVKLPRLSKGPRLAERMARERQIGASLEHPHIARLYDAGIDAGGRPYLVMELVQGVDLISYANHQALTAPARLRLMLQVCAAVAHAHRLLVVHRDIKPSNLLVDARGEVKLLDFGIAKLLDGAMGQPTATVSDESGRTHTPRYAAPEQLQGAPVTTAMDIHSLGVVLHELLTGRLPSAADPADPDEMGPDLALVVARASHADPAQRYSSAERLADDLQRMLERRPVLAGPTSLAHRVGLFAARHRAGLAAILVFIGMVATGGALLMHQHAQETLQAQRAQQARNFLLDLMEDAEPAAGQASGPVTGLQMLNSALDRARRGFDGQPALRGNVLVQLGHMFKVLDQPDQSLAVLREAHQLLAQSVDIDDPTLHVAEAQLAIAFSEHDEPDAPRQARSWANTALEGCGADTALCAKARAYAHDVLRNLANASGDTTQALLHARLAVQAYQRGFGSEHSETALAWRNQAIIQRNQGALRDAADSITNASRIAASAPLRANDLLDLRMKQALLQTDLGAYAPARAALEALLAEHPPTPARVEQSRMLAQVLLAQGLLPAAEAAADAAARDAQGAQLEWDRVMAVQTRAIARSALGRHADAQRDIAAALTGLQQLGLPAESVPQQRARRFAAEIALRAGQFDAAAAMAKPLLPLAGIHRAQVLVLQGVLARQSGDAGGAVALHTQAAALLAAELPRDHPLRLRTALELALAQWLAGGAGDRSALSAARADYVRAWPQGSAWKDVPDAQTATSAAWQRVVL
ncbi:protein kinase domain-containing protein [Roseateles sp. NT4]|uniref:serine/threonine-protein kinase n=1 Tax=Roseateles sp. NT4 TaxID=3453715 RepID=UPI003EEAD5B2